MKIATRCLLLTLSLGLSGFAIRATAAPAMGPTYAANYTISDLGAVPGVPASYGGLTFLAGNPDVLLIGGKANEATGSIYSIAVTRDVNHRITGFDGTATPFALSANIDGGLAYAPNETLFFATYMDNTIGQILPGNTSPSSFTSLTPLGVTPSTGTLAFVPDGFIGAGNLWVASYSTSLLYQLPISPVGDGTYSFSNASLISSSLSGGPEGIAFVLGGNPDFSVNSVLISAYNAGEVYAYALDGSGLPTGSASIFVSGLAGAEGAVIDPLTGDFLFSTFGTGGSVQRVSGFTQVPEPGQYVSALGLAALAAAGLRRWRR